METEQEMNSNPQPKRDMLLPASIMVAGLMISASIIYLVGSKDGGGKAEPVPVGGGSAGGLATGPTEIGGRDVVLGDSNARVTLIEYGDFQCPFCAKFHVEVGPQLREEYIKTGKVKMVFRNLQFLGPESVEAGEAAECAKDQNKFWEFHDSIYDEELRDGKEHNGNLNRDFFLRTAQALGLDAGEFTACYDSNKYADQITQDRNAAAALGVNSTPTTFVNGRLLRGALPYADFKTVIEEELKK